MSNPKILIGADPELFCMVGDKYVSAHDLLPGTKAEPFFVENGAVQVDGVAAEFNIDPASSEDEFIHNMNSVVEQMTLMIQSINDQVRLVCTPTAWFDKDYFELLPYETKLLGCEPDFDAKTGDQNPKPKTDKPFRTGSCHIHVGWTSGADPYSKEHFELCRKVVLSLDETLYPMSMEWDDDQTRRELYGKEGSFRPKSYGFEYRPLSNKALESEEVLRLIYQTVVEVTQKVLSENLEQSVEASRELRAA
jgi:hypothetical protein